MWPLHVARASPRLKAGSQEGETSEGASHITQGSVWSVSITEDPGRSCQLLLTQTWRSAFSSAEMQNRPTQKFSGGWRMRFPCGSADRESACNVGDLGSIPGLGRSPGQIGKGVRQGCILSPCLFNFYAEYIMRNAELEEEEEVAGLGAIPTCGSSPGLWAGRAQPVWLRDPTLVRS